MTPLFLHPGHLGSSVDSPLNLVAITAASVGVAAVALFGGDVFRRLRRGTEPSVELVRWAGGADPWWAELQGAVVDGDWWIVDANGVSHAAVATELGGGRWRVMAELQGIRAVEIVCETAGQMRLVLRIP